jgi:DNA-binding XRE family transcriptional regulator
VRRSKEIQEWIDQNPLRKYRTERDLAQFEVSAKIDVSINTIRNWETGASEPRGDYWQKLNWLLGEDAEKLWKEWKAKFPNKAEI